MHGLRPVEQSRAEQGRAAHSVANISRDDTFLHAVHVADQRRAGVFAFDIFSSLFFACKHAVCTYVRGKTYIYRAGE